MSVTADTSEQTESQQFHLFSQVKNHIDGIGTWFTSNIPKLYAFGSVDKENAEPVLMEVSHNLQRSGNDEESQQKTVEDDSSTPLVDIQNRAKSLGNLFYTTVSEVGGKIKKTIEENAYLVEFNKEQEVFIKGRATNVPAVGLPPWVGCPNEGQLKDACLCLSGDRRNFFRPPPAGIDFQFNYEVSYPTALAIMEQDPRLQAIRYELVPIVVSEENFWRNYFYRVGLVCQANEILSVSQEYDGEPVVAGSAIVAAEQEFVSDSYQKTAEDLSGVEWEFKNLNGKDEGWERDLEEELQDYDVPNAENNIDNIEEELAGALKEELE